MTAPEVNPDIKAQNKNVQWYKPDLEAVSPRARELLENYSHIPLDEVIPHILKICDCAWSIFLYSCIGRFHFLNRLLHSSYTLLDLGCCFAQDIRKLVYDGVPSTSLYGAELRPEFIELGYEFFKDKETLKSTFLIGGLFTGEHFRELEEGGGGGCYGTQWDVRVKLQQDGADDKRYYAETQGFEVERTRGEGSLYFEVTRL